MGKSREEQEEEYQQQKRNVLWDMFNPMSGGFGIGSILKIFLYMTGAYFLLRHEGVQKFVGKLFGEGGDEKVRDFVEGADVMLAGLLPEQLANKLFPDALGRKFDHLTAEKAKKFLKGKVDDGLLNVLTADETSWRNFTGTIKAAQPDGKLGFDDLMNDHSVFALITKQPELTKKMVTAMSAAGETGDSKKNKEKLMKAIAAIASDDRLATLMSDAHRDNMVALMLKMDPNNKMTPAVLSESLKNLGLDGTRKLILGMTTAKEDGTATASASDALKSVSEDPAIQNDPKKKEALANVVAQQAGTIVGASNTAAVETLKNALGTDRFLEFTTLATAQPVDTKALTMFATKSANLPAFHAFANQTVVAELPLEMQASINQLKALPQAALAPIGRLSDLKLDPLKLQEAFVPNGAADPVQFARSLLDKNNRALINNYFDKSLVCYGTANVSELIGALVPQYKHIMTPHNLSQMVKAADIMARNISNQNNPDRTDRVLSAFVAYATGAGGEVMKTVTAKEISDFFKEKDNRVAFAQIFNHMQVPGKQGEMLGVFKKHWGNIDNGIAEVFADEAGAAFMREQMISNTKSDTWDWVKEAGLKRKGGKIAENASHLMALSAVDVPSGTAVTPKNTGPMSDTHINWMFKLTH